MHSPLKTLSTTLSVALFLTPPVHAAGVQPQSSDGSGPPTIEVESDNYLSSDVDSIARGRKTYSNFCAQCHGVKADGVAPRFGQYAADLRTFQKGYSEFVNIVAVGVVEKAMPPWGEFLDVDQISEIGAYLETLAIEGARWTDIQ